MTLFVTRVHATVAYGADGTAQRITRAIATVAYADRTIPPKLSRNHVTVIYADRTIPPKVTRIHLTAIVSANSNYLIDAGQLSGGFTFESIDAFVTHDNAVPQVPEFNPYRPTLTASYDPVEFHREQTETIREQHNLTQAGDTTFPWQMLTQVQTSTNPLFTLGSLGRFYHENYGIIMARYVQFKNMSPMPLGSSPLGLLKSEETLSWKVTDRLDLSDSNLVIGLAAAYAPMIEDGFGWAVVSGVMTRGIPRLVEANDSVQSGTPYAWAQTGRISQSASGRIIGRIISPTTTGNLAPGSFRVEIESWSPSQILALMAPQFEVINTAIQAIQEILGPIGDGQTNADVQIVNLQNQINTLIERIAREESIRAAAVRGLNSRIDNLDAMSQSEFDAAINALVVNLNQTISLVAITADDAQAKANEALALINAIGVIDLQPINDAIADIYNRLVHASTSLIPVVDGGIPPALIYLPDGSLVFVEVPLP